MAEPRLERHRVAGLPTLVERLGDGPAVLALHALELGAGREEWRPLAARLAAAGYEVIAPDWPGCGDSDPLPRYTSELFQTWLAGLLDHYPHATDWLARGQAAAYAIAAGRRCRSLAVISPDGLHPEPVREDVLQQYTGPAGPAAYQDLLTPEAVAAWLGEQYAAVDAGPPGELDHVLRRARQPGAEGFFAAWASGSLRLDVRREWITLAQPLLMIWGELADDPPLERVDDWLMPLRPDAPVMMIQGRPIGIWKQNVTYKSFRTGPRPQLEQPEAVAKVVLEHLANATR